MAYLVLKNEQHYLPIDGYGYISNADVCSSSRILDYFQGRHVAGQRAFPQYEKHYKARRKLTYVL